MHQYQKLVNTRLLTKELRQLFKWLLQSIIYRDNQMKPKKSKQRQAKDKILNEIPIFIANTYRIVDNPDYADTIEWIPEENGFIVKNITKLTEQVFPKHFKHTNYASFVRQLNLYGFHKVRSNEQGNIFTHNYFQKNSPELLPLIKRKTVNGTEADRLQRSSELALVSPSPTSLMLMPNNNDNQQLQKQLGSLTQKHQSLQNLVSVLVEQNKEIILQNKSFISKINSLDDSYRKKLETLIFLMVFGLKNGDNSIIVPQQLNHMIKAFTSSKKQKKSKANNVSQNGNNGNSNNSQAVQLFKKPGSDQNRFNNKRIEQILAMLKSEGEQADQNSDLDEIKTPVEEQPPVININLQKKQSHNNNDSQISHDIPLFAHPPSPISSLRSLPSRYLNDNKLSDDWNDFLDKLENSDIEIEAHKE